MGRAGGPARAVLLRVGGGGLIGGLARGFEQLSGVVALEPELAPPLYKAREAGQPVDVSVSGIAADSLGAKRIGGLGWEATQAHVRDALLLTDESIRAAQLWLGNELKRAVEHGAAMPRAAPQSGRNRPRTDEKEGLNSGGEKGERARQKEATAGHREGAKEKNRKKRNFLPK